MLLVHSITLQQATPSIFFGIGQPTLVEWTRLLMSALFEDVMLQVFANGMENFSNTTTIQALLPPTGFFLSGSHRAAALWSNRHTYLLLTYLSSAASCYGYC